MIATPHLQNHQGLSHRGFDLDWLESNDTVDQEAQSYLGDCKRPSCHLWRLPNHHGTYSLGLEVHDQPVRLAPQLAFLDEHSEMAQRVHNYSPGLDIVEGFV